MSATRVRYLLKQWRLRSVTLSRLDELSKKKDRLNPAEHPPSPPPPPEKRPATPE